MITQEETNVVNSAFVHRKVVSVSLYIPKLKSVLVVQPGRNFPGIPETDFAKNISEGLGITDGDLYYVTVPVGSELHIITQDIKRVIVECNDDGVDIKEL